MNYRDYVPLPIQSIGTIYIKINFTFLTFDDYRFIGNKNTAIWLKVSVCRYNRYNMYTGDRC